MKLGPRNSTVASMTRGLALRFWHQIFIPPPIGREFKRKVLFYLFIYFEK